MEISQDKPTEIEICSASVFFGKERILENVSLSIREQRVGFIGRNGSGKTTLLRILAGLQELNKGKVLIDGTEVAKKRKEAIKKVGIIFQNPDHQIIFPTVGEELRFGLTQLGLNKNEADLKVIACLKKYDKVDWFERSISTLSQGQKHLVCLLSVLLMKPRVLLLDEPFTGIDIPTQLKLEHYLSSLKQTIIHVSHMPETFADYQRLIWIDEGVVQADGTPKTVIKKYRTAMKNYNEKTI
ncbi:MAG: energy-coupling factor ABC transporter ATP-binding protein [Paracoccaceae bacterium]